MASPRPNFSATTRQVNRKGRRAGGGLLRAGLAASLPLLLLSFGCSIENAKKHYVLAEKLWYDGKYAAAVNEFDRVTAQDPKGKLGLQALYRSAVTENLFLARYEDAVRRLRTYADEEATTDPAAAWEAQRQIGEILFSKLDQYDRAILHYKALLQQRPDTPEAPDFLFRIGKSEFYLWQFDAAVATYRDLIKRYRNSPLAERAAYEIGVTYFTRGEQRPGGSGPGVEAYQDAIDAYQKFERAYPQSALVPEAQFGVASCLEEMDQLDAAYHAYEALRGPNRYPAPKVIEIKLARIRERKAQRSQ